MRNLHSTRAAIERISTRLNSEVVGMAMAPRLIWTLPYNALGTTKALGRVGVV